MMKFAAIKGQMGIWKYYVTALTFEEVSKYVSPITKEISNSDSYANILQRAITDNVSSITDYILNQKERLFNALVLALYDGNPEWAELDVEVEDYSTFSVGVLELSGEEIIFPVDGQHRVEGIREAVKRNPKLANEKVPIILIGHENSKEGKERTRRLFSTLNRRAKRVKDNEIIALDEDDVIAIATREIAENDVLFAGNKLIDSPNKNIPSTNGIAFTSILTLYEVNKIIYSQICSEKGMSKSQQEKYLLYRPDEDEVEEFVKKIREYWELFVSNIDCIQKYVNSTDDVIIESGYRSIQGGNLLFRPIALSQFVLATYEYQKRTGKTIRESISHIGKIPMEINERPWKNILWLDERKSINGRVRKKELKTLMLFLADPKILGEKEKDELIQYVLSMRDLDKSMYNDIEEQLIEYSLKS